MSFAGFKKQLNKANQFMSEKIGGAKGSQLEEDFIELERKTDATAKLVDSLQDKTKEYLQPNPAARAKLSMQSTVQKVRGEARVSKYPQTEGILGETLNKGGMEIGEDSLFGQALIEAGEAFKQCAEIKDALDTSVKQNFLDPLHQLQERDIKEIMAHRKKLSGRRLDYDCKKRKAHKVTEEEIRIAEEKFEESKELCYSSMLNLIESDVEQISQLAYLSEAILDFHTHCGEVMRSLVSTLNDRVSEASSRPRTERQRSSFRSSFKATNDGDTDSVDSSKGSYAFGSTPAPTPSDPTPSATTPSAPPAAEVPPSTGGELYKAMYDFEQENEGELGFNEGDIITVTDRIDENWLEGTLNGRKGLFPANYVEKM